MHFLFAARGVFMKRIARIISSIAIVTLIGCNRESRSTRGPDAVAQKPTASGAAKGSSTGGVMTGAAEWERAFKAQQKQYEKVEELAKVVSKVCAGTNGEEAVDALLAKSVRFGVSTIHCGRRSGLFAMCLRFKLLSHGALAQRLLVMMCIPMSFTRARRVVSE